MEIDKNKNYSPRRAAAAERITICWTFVMLILARVEVDAGGEFGHKTV